MMNTANRHIGYFQKDHFVQIWFEIKNYKYSELILFYFKTFILDIEILFQNSIRIDSLNLEI